MIPERKLIQGEVIIFFSSTHLREEGYLYIEEVLYSIVQKYGTNDKYG